MPEENVNTAQTSEATAAQDGAAETVQSTEDSTTDALFTDGGSEGGAAEEKTSEKATKPPQTKEQNSEMARRRREAERQKELKELRENTIIETLGGKNPYTGGEMKDSADVEEYLTMKEIEKNGGDPVADFSKFQKENTRREREKAESEAQTAEWYRKDGEAFKDKYPDVDLMELAKDESFADYAEGKIGKKPLASIYEGYLKIKGSGKTAIATDEQVRAAAAQMIANKKASVGSLSSANGSEEFFTREDVSKMSVPECEKNYDKIIKSMKYWQ